MEPSRAPLDDIAVSILAGKLGKEWKQLALRIGVTAEKLDTIRANNPLHTINQIIEMLLTWRRMQGRDDDVVSILAEALKSVGRTDLAEEMLADQKTSTSSTNFDIRALRAELIEHYKNTTCKVPTHPLFPAWVRDMSEIYVDLYMADKNDQSHRQSPRSADPPERDSLQGSEKARLQSHGELVGLDGPGKYRVLLKGKPGSGKSTVIKKVTYDWSSLEDWEEEKSQSEAEAVKPHQEQPEKLRSSFSKFTLLFPLKLNKMINDTGIVDSICGQILARDTKVSKVGLKDYIESQQEKVLFLLDGLDELPASVFEEREGDNYLMDVLKGRALRRCCVIVTSRHHRASQLLKCYPHFACVEITGFAPKERDSYIKKYFASLQNQAQLISEMEASTSLRHLAEIPLLLLMMCLVWEAESGLPKRLTELYENVVEILLMHQATKHGVPLSNQSQLPHQLMNRLGQVALQGLLDSGGERLVFSADDFSQEDIVKACDIGLLISDTVAAGLKAESTVSFLHKSFQELCAAFYLAELAKTSKKQFKKYIKCITVDRVGDMEYLLRFCCGKSTQAAKMILRHVQKLEKHNLYFERSQSQRLRLMLAFEAGSKKLASFLSDVTSFPNLKGEDLLAANCFLQNVRCLTSVKKLSVECTSSTEMSLLMAMLSHTPNLQDLICHKGPQGTPGEETSVQIPCLRKLTTVYFFDNPASRSSGQTSSLVPRFISQQVNMTHIHLLGIDMHGWMGSLRPHARAVVSLSLTNSGLLTADINILCDILSGASSLKALTLSGNSLHGLFQNLVFIGPSLEMLELSKCGILDDDVESLAKLLSAAQSLKRLSLSNNNMHGRLNVLAPVVPHLDTLHLDYCGLKDSDADTLSMLLPSAENLRKLHLLHNDFGNTDDIKFMVCMKVPGDTYLLLSYDVFGWTSQL
ncbi:nucleotide-binding oligomerization domain-containing protein 2-like [Acanthaster planci]|uniref:Nucleotide-binding oligomerization domain-containing protein 2-like n=1 Tax=Acanthaster planci TaxID=133434 RepID=A0A8B7Z9F9_ACAPL|nr:nucleotide-binding oligomerization domain-containing protein 2-like [Acanthaster planci]